MILQNLLFPSGIIYDRKNDRVLTNRINSFFAPIPELVRVLRGSQNGENTILSTSPVRVTLTGEISNFLIEDLEQVQQLEIINF